MKRDIERLKDELYTRLDEGLSSNLHYHNLEHTVYIYERACDLAERAKVSEKNLELIKVAAIYHDAGFLKSNQEHEKNGCEMVRAELPDWGYNPEEIEIICNMIMSTKIPQNPHSPLEELICDADLYYLGTSDYDLISDRLFRELKANGILEKEQDWLKMQIKFLEGHHYFSSILQGDHEKVKHQHLSRLKAALGE